MNDSVSTYHLRHARTEAAADSLPRYVVAGSLPPCECCTHVWANYRPAEFDAPIKHNRRVAWAFVCGSCYGLYAANEHEGYRLLRKHESREGVQVNPTALMSLATTHGERMWAGKGNR